MDAVFLMDQLADRQTNGEMFRFITENSSDIISLHKADTTVLYTSPVLDQILGYEPEQLVGKSPLSIMHPEDQKNIRLRYLELLARKERPEIATFVFRIPRADGTYAWLESTVRSIMTSDGVMNGFIAVSRDITERKKIEDHLRSSNELLQKLSTVDSLTGAANRRYFDETLKKEWSRGIRNHYPISLVLFDVDHFKRYNDYYGHLAGDNCLRMIAQKTLETFPRLTDFVARYGGEEFAVILPNTPPDMSLMLADKLRANIEELAIEHAKSDVSSYVTLSLGVAHYTPDLSVKPELLIAQADEALYEAKRSGRNQARLYPVKSE